MGHPSENSLDAIRQNQKARILELERENIQLSRKVSYLESQIEVMGNFRFCKTHGYVTCDCPESNGLSMAEWKDIKSITPRRED